VASWKLTGRAIQAVLGRTERRLNEAGMTELAHRYAPIWHQDVLVAVKKKPKPYVDLLMAESAVINATIDLGTERSVQAANRFGKTVHLNLRKLYGMDLQRLGVGTLEEATRVLAQYRVNRGDNLSDAGALQNGDAAFNVTAGRPDARITSQKNGDHRRPNGGGQMRDARVVADVHARRRDPAGQIV
jgi:hypothetical protein